MLDLLLSPEGDLCISEAGDIGLTNSIRQAVRIRLQWFFDEWRFAPQFGVPYLEEILVKNPNRERIRQLVRDEAASVDGVVDAKNVSVAIDRQSRTASVSLDVVAAEGAYREEVLIHA